MRAIVRVLSAPQQPECVVSRLGRRLEALHLGGGGGRARSPATAAAVVCRVSVARRPQTASHPKPVAAPRL
eukprot:scaffold257909_cov27-Tisochrysis_lutea.AAC.3